MGMFDTIYLDKEYTCPMCQGKIDSIQVKEFENILEDYLLVFSLIGLVVSSPLFLIIALLIKQDSKGPIFYKGERVGKDGKLFKMYKFRTMREDADKIGGGPSCADDDPRIIKFGKFLRKYKLNELHQLINVLKGEMSFVGPRPEVASEVETYNEDISWVKQWGYLPYFFLTFIPLAK